MLGAYYPPYFIEYICSPVLMYSGGSLGYVINYSVFEEARMYPS
jgi:hypothetical protein